MPAAIAIPLIAAGASAAGSVVAAKMQSGAAKDAAASTNAATTHSADLQAQAAARAEAFQRQQAEADYRNQEVARRANYDIEAARQQRLSSFGQMLGLAPRDIPAYVPSVDPGYTGGISGTPAQAQPKQTATAVPGGDYRAYFESLTGGKPLDQAGLLALAPKLQAAGIQVTKPSAAGVVSKIGLPDGTWVRVLNGDTSVASPTVWVPQPKTSAAPGTLASSAAFTPTPTSYIVPIAPALQAPKPTFAGILGS